MPFSSIAIVPTCSLRKNAMSSMVNRVGSVVCHCYTTGFNCSHEAEVNGFWIGWNMIRCRAFVRSRWS